MNRLRIIPAQALLVAIALLASTVFSQDPNFHIYLAFGQSNMEGQGAISDADKVVVERFQLFPTVACNSRTLGSPMNAIPPLFRCDTKLSPVDYFGRTLVEKLPSTIKVGVVPVAVGGSKIELFDKTGYSTYISSGIPASDQSWMIPMINQYGGNPYGRLVQVAKQAQTKGVIKGILLHQGESNTNDNDWPGKVKAIYNNLITDLGLNAADVPLLAGEVVGADQNGMCAGVNTIIAKLPAALPNSYVISSQGLPHAGDRLHFTAESYRTLGKRYAEKMLTLLNTTPVEPPTAELVWLEPDCAVIGSNWEKGTDATASNGGYIVVKAGLNSKTAAPTAAADHLVFNFNVDSAQAFTIFARVKAPTADDDSYWVKLDNGEFVNVTGLTSTEWAWKTLLASQNLTKGAHTLTIAYREDGALLDKISISNSTTSPTGMGESATCQAPLSIAQRTAAKGYSLVPTRIGVMFSIPEESYVSLKVYSTQGQEIAELAGKDFAAGNHVIGFENSTLSQGVYFLTLKANGFTVTRKVVLGNK